MIQPYPRTILMIHLRLTLQMAHNIPIASKPQRSGKTAVLPTLPRNSQADLQRIGPPPKPFNASPQEQKINPSPRSPPSMTAELQMPISSPVTPRSSPPSVELIKDQAPNSPRAITPPQLLVPESPRSNQSPCTPSSESPVSDTESDTSVADRRLMARSPGSVEVPSGLMQEARSRNEAVPDIHEVQRVRRFKAAFEAEVAKITAEAEAGLSRLGGVGCGVFSCTLVNGNRTACTKSSWLFIHLHSTFVYVDILLYIYGQNREHD